MSPTKVSAAHAEHEERAARAAAEAEAQEAGGARPVAAPPPPRRPGGGGRSGCGGACGARCGCPRATRARRWWRGGGRALLLFCCTWAGRAGGRGGRGPRPRQRQRRRRHRAHDPAVTRCTLHTLLLKIFAELGLAARAVALGRGGDGRRARGRAGYRSESEDCQLFGAGPAARADARQTARRAPDLSSPETYGKIRLEKHKVKEHDSF
ncbi:Protein of unknown function [Gryllus bimaculatus]|nr:Protein of unknown function [Gryllus bimaculatus]